MLKYLFILVFNDILINIFSDLKIYIINYQNINLLYFLEVVKQEISFKFNNIF